MKSPRLVLALASCFVIPAFAESASEPAYSLEVWPEPVTYAAPATQAQRFSAQLQQDKIAAIANQVADWQLSRYDIRSNQMRPEERASALPQGWIYATFNIGLLTWGETRNDQAYIQAIRNISAVNEWKLGPRFYHADDHAMGQVYLDLYHRYGDKHMLENLQQTFDWVLAHPSDRNLEFDVPEMEVMNTVGREFKDPWCTQRWCWADALFMSPPVWAQLASMTGDKRYLEFMDKEFWITTHYLYNKDDHLFLRDSRFFTQRDENGKPIYWGRGNGWVLAGIARIIPHLPEDFAKRADYIKLFTDMSEHIRAAQNTDGSWPSSLLDTSAKPTPESSGTGLLVFGLAWGVNNGYLDRATYLPVIEKGWQSLVRSIDKNGRMGWVQQVGFAPGSATKKDSELYGTGAFLLAAAEVYKLADTNAVVHHMSVGKKNITSVARLSQAQLVAARERFIAGDLVAVAAVNQLDAAAKKILTIKPFTIVNKIVLPASGNPHDYFSFAPYWWPNPSTENGLPYIQLDGKINPASRDKHSDKVALNGMLNSTQILSNAYFFTGDKRYAQKAAELIRAWFLDDATKMNPHLRYGQAIPGKVDGRGIGIIDTRLFYQVIDSIALINDAAVISQQESLDLKHWFNDYLDWLLHSPLGIEEQKALNNHGTFYDFQVAAIALYVGREDVVRATIAQTKKRMGSHFEPDGQQPFEMARTRPFHYSVFNLQAYFGVASIAQKLGIDVWNYPSATNATLKQGMDYLLTRMLQEKNWGGKEEATIEEEIMVPLLSEYAQAYKVNIDQYRVIAPASPQWVQCSLLFAQTSANILPTNNGFEPCAY
jgi:unsaturated rhamnogalacturonyl hydrolase